MKLLRTIGVFAVLMHCATLWTQISLQFDDHFKGDNSRWQWSAEMTLLQVDDGIEISQADPTISSLLLHELLIRQKDNYRVEAEILPEGSGLSYSWGIVWGCSRDRHSYFCFLVKADGQFCVQEVGPGNTTFLVDWTRSRKVKSDGEEPMVMAVERKGRKLYVYVDEKEIADISAPKLRGKYQGLLLEGAGKVKMSRFSLLREEHQIIHATGRFYNATRRPLDSTINTLDQHETAPLLGPDRHTLYFSRGEDSTLYAATLMNSRVQGDSMWGEPQPVFQQQLPGRVEAFSVDEKSLDLLLMPGTASSGLATSTVVDSVWQLPTREYIPAIGEQPGLITTFLNKEEDILLISANRNDSYGGQDLYVLFKKNDGSWSNPKNLGPDINTFEEEFAPWLSPDGKFLIFTSGGHPGYGGWDLYRSERLTQTWTRWSTPENLGPRINTQMDEGWYHPWKDDRAYISVQDSSRGDFDLYGLRLPVDPASQPVVRLRGRIINQKTGEPVAGNIILREIQGNDLPSTIEATGAQTGFNGYVPYQQAYQMIGMADGYFPLTDTLDLRAIDKYRDVEQDIYVAPVDVGDVIRLDKVYFQRAEAILLDQSFDELDRLVALMLAIPSLQIEIHGHTDDIGDPGELFILSESRAERVLWYLTEQGIEPSRMQAKGFGASLPVADNRNPETRPLNRRVEFVIISR